MAKAKKKPSIPHLEKAPTGIQGLDETTGGGLPRGRPTLVCGSAGCGKTLMAMEFLVWGIMAFDDSGVFVSFEETETDLAANVASFGWDLNRLSEEQKLCVEYVHIDRSEIEETGDYNLDGLFIRLEAAVAAVGAKRMAIDTLEALFGGFTSDLIMRAEIRRLFRWLKEKGLTAVITGEPGEKTMTRHGLEEYVSDCVIELGHRIYEQVATRRLRIVKYRGSSHGTNEYPFLIEDQGSPSCPSPPWGWITRSPRSGSPRGLSVSTICSGERDITGAPASSSRGPQARARVPWPRPRSFGICAPSASGLTDG